MEMKQYVKRERTINATETAYLAIYKAQGFRPKSDAPPEEKPPGEEVPQDEGADNAGADGSGAEDNAEGTPARKPKRAKQ